MGAATAGTARTAYFSGVVLGCVLVLGAFSALALPALAESARPTLPPVRGLHINVDKEIAKHAKRNEWLKEKLRKDDKFDLVLQGMDGPPMGGESVVMADADGSTATCRFEAEAPGDDGGNTRKTGGAGRGGEQSSAKQVPEDDEQSPPPSTYEEALAPLNGLCLAVNKGWWSFSWCFRNEVRQYHAEPDGKRSADWSLGKFDDARSVDKPLGSGSYHSHFFDGGQRCDETGAGRATEVRFFCCEPSGDMPASIQTIDEPELCTYNIDVCTLLVCPSSVLGSAGSAPTASGPLVEPGTESLQKLVKPMETGCAQRHEGWWSYEFCFGKHVRQFHLETVKDGSKTYNKVGADISLGTLEPGVEGIVDAEKGGVHGSDGGAARQRAAEKHPHLFDDGAKVSNTPIRGTTLHTFPGEPERSYLLQRFEGGDVCDLAGVPRTTLVRMVCPYVEGNAGGESVNQVVSVSEDSTCHYSMTFASSLLCSHPAFAPEPEPLLRVVCDSDAAGDVPTEGVAREASAEDTVEAPKGDADVAEAPNGVAEVVVAPNGVADVDEAPKGDADAVETPKGDGAAVSDGGDAVEASEGDSGAVKAPEREEDAVQAPKEAEDAAETPAGASQSHAASERQGAGGSDGGAKEKRSKGFRKKRGRRAK